MIHTKKSKIFFIAVLSAALMLFLGCPAVGVKPGNAGSQKKPNTQNTQKPDNSGQPAPFIPEYVPVTEVVLHDVNDKPIPETIVINVGEQYRLKPVIKPENATDKKVRYEHGDGVSITEDGLVTGKKKGAETLNVWVDGKKYVSAGFQIKSDSTIDFDKTEIKTDYTTDSTAVVITKKSAHSVYHCTLRYADGKGNWVNRVTASNGLKDTITVDIEENKSAFERRAYLVFKSDSTNRAKLIREIPIIQEAHPNPVLRTEWVHGITPPSGTELEYGGHNVNPKYGVWKETSTTTWFNAKKSQDKTDSEMCWAMSTADLLHWWMKQNEENLKRVIQQKGISSGTDEYKLYLGEYNRNLSERKSGVANVFRKRFTNHVHGTALNSAVGWYLLGMTAGGELTPQYSSEPAPGIVKGIFSDLNELIKPSYAHDKQEFKKTIKAALDEHNAFAVQFILGKAGLHVVTVWGVEFDADENITALWVSDSNDANSQLTKFGVHYPNGLPHKINYAVANDKGETLITDVITMKNAKQQFKTWLDSNNY
ncbi:IdeS/Mac family cysteine endopeptidase [Treponema sp. HNW]|uniref:IdeS/Mac family cysteine endopeptidase n=1 Tax=Treponema sp. HNW TaxID=3116654 RepID=UPI003D12CB8A